jgi:hypothetical protein
VTFSLFWALQTHFRVGRNENKEKRLFYFGLIILLPIRIQLLEIESPKLLKSTSPNAVYKKAERNKPAKAFEKNFL